MPQQTPTDPWVEAAKNFKAAPQGETAPSGGDDWKVWQQHGDSGQSNWESNTEPIDTGHAFSDFVHNAGGRAAKAFVQPLSHPLDTLKSLTQSPWVSAANMAHDYATSQHPIADVTGDLAAGALQGGLLGAAGEGLDAVPSRARAGRVFQSVAQAAAGQPVNMTRSMPILERAQQLSDAGHGTIGPIDSLYKRVNTVNPLDYSEARDRASALSSLTGNDKMSATNSLKSQARQLSHAFNEDVGDTASSVGRGEDYQRAMKEYARASALRDTAKGVMKWAIPATGAAGGYELYRALTGR